MTAEPHMRIYASHLTFSIVKLHNHDNNCECLVIKCILPLPFHFGLLQRNMICKVEPEKNPNSFSSIIVQNLDLTFFLTLQLSKCPDGINSCFQDHRDGLLGQNVFLIRSRMSFYSTQYIKSNIVNFKIVSWKIWRIPQ